MTDDALDKVLAFYRAQPHVSDCKAPVDYPESYTCTYADGKRRGLISPERKKLRGDQDRYHGNELSPR